MLDLSHILLADHDIARFATKREAVIAVARARGWNACDVMRAYNRFNVFWVVGERLTDGIRLATRTAVSVRLPYRDNVGEG
jgi:hypothetical protein